MFWVWKQAVSGVRHLTWGLWFQEKFGPGSKKRRLAVHIISMIEGGAGVKVNEVDSLKGDGEYPENVSSSIEIIIQISS